MDGFDGQPIAFHLTGWEAGDSPIFKTLLDAARTCRAALLLLLLLVLVLGERLASFQVDLKRRTLRSDIS
jgi:hypothetical protein